MKPEVNTPSLNVLSFMLRNRETWPPGFEWDFAICSKCAMGLARLLWKERMPVPGVTAMMNAFNIPIDEASDIFAHGAPNWSDVTPEIVADRIDSYLSTLET